MVHPRTRSKARHADRPSRNAIQQTEEGSSPPSRSGNESDLPSGAFEPPLLVRPPTKEDEAPLRPNVETSTEIKPSTNPSRKRPLRRTQQPQEPPRKKRGTGKAKVPKAVTILDIDDSTEEDERKNPTAAREKIPKLVASKSKQEHKGTKGDHSDSKCEKETNLRSVGAADTASPVFDLTTEDDRESSSLAFNFERLDKTVSPIFGMDREHILAAPSSCIAVRSLNFIATAILPPDLRPSTVWLCDPELAQAYFFADENAKAKISLPVTKAFWEPILSSVSCFIPLVHAGHWSLLAIKNLATVVECWRTQQNYQLSHCACDKSVTTAEHMDSLRGSPHSPSSGSGIMYWAAKGVRAVECGAGEQSNVEGSIVRCLFEHYGDIVSLPCNGQQHLPDLTCGWFTVLNARHHIRGLPFQPPGDEKEDISHTIRIVKDLCYEYCAKAGSYRGSVTERTREVSGTHTLFPGDAVKYVAPDCLQFLMDAMDICAKDCGWDKLGGAPLRATQEKVRTAMTKHIKKMVVQKKFKFRDGASTATISAKLTGRVAPVLLSMRGEGGSAPVFRAMRMHRTSKLVYLNLDIVFGECVEVGENTIETPRMWTTFKAMFKASETYGYNTAKLLCVFAESARTVLQVITVHLAALAEYILLVALKCSVAKLDQVTEMHDFLKNIKLMDETVVDPFFNPRKSWAVEIDMIELCSLHIPSAVLDTFKVAAELTTEAIEEGQRNFCKSRNISAHYLKREKCDYVQEGDMASLPSEFAAAFATKIISYIREKFFPQFHTHPDTKKTMLHLLDLVRSSIISVEYSERTAEPYTEAEIFDFEPTRTNRGRPPTCSSKSALVQGVSGAVHQTGSTLPSASAQHEQDRIDVRYMELLSLGCEHILFHGEDSTTIFYSALLEILHPFLDNTHMKTNCAGRSGNCGLWSSLKKQFDIDAELYQQQTAVRIRDDAFSTPLSRYVGAKQAAALLLAAGAIIEAQGITCLIPYRRKDHFGFEEVAQHPRHLTNVHLQWRGKVQWMNELNEIRSCTLGRWNVGSRRGVGPIAAPPSRARDFDYGAVTCQLGYTPENDKNLNEPRNLQDRPIRFREGDFIRIDVTEGGHVVANLFGFCIEAQNPTRELRKERGEQLEITVFLQNRTGKQGTGESFEQLRKWESPPDKSSSRRGNMSLTMFRVGLKYSAVRESLHYFQGASKLISAPPSFSFLLSDVSLHLKYELRSFRILCGAIQRTLEVRGGFALHYEGSGQPIIFENVADIARHIRGAATLEINNFLQKQNVKLTEEQKSVLLPWCSFVEGIRMILGPEKEMSRFTELFDPLKRRNGIIFSSCTSVVGPPGSGKSSVALTAIRAVLHMYDGDTLQALRTKRVLFLSCTNNSVDDVMLKYMDTCSQSDGSDLPIRIGVRSSHQRVKQREVNNLLGNNSLTGGTRRQPASRKDVINRAKVVFATFGSALFEEWTNIKGFDVILVDEGAYVNETLLVAVLSKLFHQIRWLRLGPFIIIIGDHRQMSPFDGGQYQFWKKDSGLSHRFFERNVKQLTELIPASQMVQKFEGFPHPLVTLTVQFRMSAAICRLVSENFYDGKLLTGERSNSRAWVIDNIEELIASSSFPARTATVLDTTEESSFKEMACKPGRVNRKEADLIIKILGMWTKTIQVDLLKGRIAVFTPYTEQVELIRKLMKKTDMVAIELHVATIDSAQGEEFDIVILSMVRTALDHRGGISFLDNPHQICVALSRAKERVVVIGNCKTLATAVRSWSPILRTIHSRSTESSTSDDHAFFNVKSGTGQWKIGICSDEYTFEQNSTTMPKPSFS